MAFIHNQHPFIFCSFSIELKNLSSFFPYLHSQEQYFPKPFFIRYGLTLNSYLPLFGGKPRLLRRG